jgi:hypothetical protein
MVGLLGRGISPFQGHYLHTGQHKQNKRTQTSMPRMKFEPTTPAFERVKTVDALDCDRPVNIHGPYLAGRIVIRLFKGIWTASAHDIQTSWWSLLAGWAKLSRPADPARVPPSRTGNSGCVCFGCSRQTAGYLRWVCQLLSFLSVSIYWRKN